MDIFASAYECASTSTSARMQVPATAPVEDFRRTSRPFNVATVGTLGVGSKTKVYIL